MTECCTFVIGGLPRMLTHPFKTMRTVRWMQKNLDGLVSIYAYDRGRTFLVFKTLNEAKVARNQILAAGGRAGDIARAEIGEDKVLRIKELAE